jgi:hypothetical protein
MKLCSKSKRRHLIILTETERPLNISGALSMTFATEAHQAEGQLRRLKSTLNKLNSLKFRFGTRNPTVSKRVEQYFEPLKTSIK